MISNFNVLDAGIFYCCWSKLLVKKTTPIALSSQNLGPNTEINLSLLCIQVALYIHKI